MRISDWSSDVCSSDLAVADQRRRLGLKGDGAVVARADISGFERRGGVPVEIAPARVARRVVPCGAPARLTVVRGTEAALRIGAHQPAQMREPGGGQRAAPRNADARGAGSVDRRGRTAWRERV